MCFEWFDIESSSRKDDDSDYARYASDNCNKREIKQTEKVNSKICLSN